MITDCIIIQGHVGDFDPQGNLLASEKIKLVSLSLLHLRLNNPHAYIILTGHGHRPNTAALNACDKILWKDQLDPIDQASGYFPGNPAQRTFVYAGIRAGIRQAFVRMLKTRLDSLIGIPNITNQCDRVLGKEGKRLLVTQQTCHTSKKLGDCFIYGESVLQDFIWDSKHLAMHPTDGLIHTGHYLDMALGYEDSWNKKLRDNIAFRDTTSLLFMDLRWHYHEIVTEFGTWKNFEAYILNGPDLSIYRKYQWGRQWHRINDEGIMEYRYMPDLISQKEWYANG